MPDAFLLFITNWPEHLSKYLSICGAPLSYVIHNDEDVLDQVMDLAFHTPELTYTLMQSEIINRALHGTPQFQMDNSKVWHILQEAIHEFQMAQAGQGAW